MSRGVGLWTSWDPNGQKKDGRYLQGRRTSRGLTPLTTPSPLTLAQRGAWIGHYRKLQGFPAEEVCGTGTAVRFVVHSGSPRAFLNALAMTRVRLKGSRRLLCKKNIPRYLLASAIFEEKENLGSPRSCRV
jgi:hypothetical protein